MEAATRGWWGWGVSGGVGGTRLLPLTDSSNNTNEKFVSLKTCMNYSEETQLRMSNDLTQILSVPAFSFLSFFYFFSFSKGH